MVSIIDKIHTQKKQKKNSASIAVHHHKVLQPGPQKVH